MAKTLTRRLKMLVKRTPIYRSWYERKLARELGTWTANDERRKQFYGQFVRPGDVCFDVGANVGNRTKILVSLGAKVVAVEPQPACMGVLRRAYGGDGRVALVRAALGSAPGKMEMMVDDVLPAISSLSQRWVEAVKASGRFSHYDWDRRVTVDLTTLDQLIVTHGKPSFIKIDVEGFEYEVLKGLSQAVAVLSFEFTPECFDMTERSVRHLASLGPITATYSLGESMVMRHERWLAAEDVLRELAGITSNTAFGDVYVRFGT